jgi:hypothetical protein
MYRVEQQFAVADTNVQEKTLKSPAETSSQTFSELEGDVIPARGTMRATSNHNQDGREDQIVPVARSSISRILLSTRSTAKAGYQEVI